MLILKNGKESYPILLSSSQILSAGYIYFQQAHCIKKRLVYFVGFAQVFEDQIASCKKDETKQTHPSVDSHENW